jgi:hypothetical protein
MSAQDIEDEFPTLQREGYAITSVDTTDYNCFAWAMHDDSEWWSPIKTNGYYWPEGRIPRNTDLDTFIALYGYEGGFVPCQTGDYEPGHEKIALYADHQRQVTHVARQKPGGLWTSKLGSKEDIDHQTLRGLEDDGTSLQAIS